MYAIYRQIGTDSLVRNKNDWEIMIEVVNSEKYPDKEVSGIIVIPRLHKDYHEKTRLDGASIPLPWLVSFLTASIVHDFAFEYGHLYYRQEDGSIDKQVLLLLILQ
jgi:hypothetical protein